MNHRLVTKRPTRCFLILCAVLLLAGAAPGPAQAVADQAGYTRVYESQTSLPLAATVCWQAGKDALDIAREDVRPASALVYLDASLRVLTEKGELIAPTLLEYLQNTASAMIPALYVRDEQTAALLYNFLQASGRKDIFVAAGWQSAALIKKLADLPHIRGLIDFSSMEQASGDVLLQIIQTTNASGAKVALIPQQLATGDNVRFLQDRLITVWAQAENDQASLIGALTRGVNGIVVSDYKAAYDAIGFFKDDAPTLLRVPRIAGHRGMPSEYAENTLMSAQGAFSAGADVIENDIYLSRDGQLFISHDQSLKRLFDRADIRDSESLTLAELQQIPFSFSGFNGVPSANNQPAATSRYGYIAEDSSLRIPALREYYEIYKNTDIVHFVEIKSHDTAIVPALKALCEEMGTTAQTVVITFNTEILETMKSEWPEMSVGALGTEGANQGDGQPGFMDYGAIIRTDGVESALALLFKVLEPWNATYHPQYAFTYRLAEAGRHRGLTVWPWTYNDPRAFADAYLKGVYGLTTNFAWWASDLVTSVIARDAQLLIGETVPLPQFTTQSGNNIDAESLTLLTISGDAVQYGQAVHTGESVLIWRALRNLVIDGQDYGTYYLYSEPFAVRVE
ncbi:MAG TPA: glycerophosphodiester phosphodiesterase family protein [Desulfuromonadaceae bacterium]